MSGLLDLEEQIEQAERPCRRNDDRDQLSDELSATAVEQAGDVAGDAVEAVTVGAVGEQAEGDHAPRAVDAVDGRGADRVVNLHDTLDEDDGADDKEASDDRR